MITQSINSTVQLLNHQYHNKFHSPLSTAAKITNNLAF